MANFVFISGATRAEKGERAEQEQDNKKWQQSGNEVTDRAKVQGRFCSHFFIFSSGFSCLFPVLKSAN